MKKIIINTIYIILILLITIEVLIKSTLVIKSVKFSFNIWTNNIFPSLFPFFIIGSILIELGLPEILGELLKSAKYTKELLDKNLIDEKDATKLLTFTHFSNPLFVISLTNFTGIEKKMIIPILISHYLSNLIIGIMLRNYNKKDINNSKVSLKNIKLERIKLSNIISNSIKNSINTLLLILGSTTIFLILNTILNDILHINGILKPIINGIFEMTQGLKLLENTNVSSNIKSLIAVSILSFGGLSVHMQIITIISETNIKYFPYFISRILHVIISILLLLLII